MKNVVVERLLFTVRSTQKALTLLADSATNDAIAGSSVRHSQSDVMKKTIASLLCAFALPLAALAASDLKEAKFTQVFNDVQIIASDKSIKPAAVNDLFDIPDILRTGPSSRAELVAADRTITRVGANTIFSFDPANRTIDLQQGSLLFHSDHGKGGGTIRTGAATASVLGTTIIVVTTRNGGFKVLVLEGNSEMSFANGFRQHLKAGQMIFVLPGGKPSPVLLFRLDTQIKNSLLVKGFTIPLTSLALIQLAINDQNKLILSGQAVQTGLLAGDQGLLSIRDDVQTSSSSSMAIPDQAQFMNGDLVGASISAKTIVLQNVNLIGPTVLDCATGLLAPNPNSNQSVKIGDVNFIGGVTYYGSPAQYFIGRGIAIGVAPQ
jgi:hypothetical protein